MAARVVLLRIVVKASLSILTLMLLFTGCASFSGKQGNASVDSPVRLFNRCSFAEIDPGDNQLQFTQGNLVLTGISLQISTNSGQPSLSDLTIPIKDIDRVALYRRDVTHGNQLQVSWKNRLVVIHLMTNQMTSDDTGTEQIYGLLVSDGVHSHGSNQYYYVGMDLSKNRSGDSSSDPVRLAIGARIGDFFVDTFKSLGQFILPF